MPFRLYKAWNKGEEARHVGIRISFEDDRWVSTCCEADAQGREKPGGRSFAPKFYGVTADQAHRRMLETLENSYDEIEPVGKEMPSL